MKKHFLILIIVFAVPFFNCETNITQVKTQNGIARFPMVGNVEIKLDFESANGLEVIVTNNNARAVGVYITKAGESSIIVFSDSWIGKGKTSATKDT